MSSIQNNTQSIGLLKTSLDLSPNKDRDTLSKFIDDSSFSTSTEGKSRSFEDFSKKRLPDQSQEKELSSVAQNVFKQSASCLLSCCFRNENPQSDFIGGLWDLDEEAASDCCESIPDFDPDVMDALTDPPSEMLSHVMPMLSSFSEEPPSILFMQSLNKEKEDLELNIKQETHGLIWCLRNEEKEKKSHCDRYPLYFEESEIDLLCEKEVGDLLSISLEKRAVDNGFDHNYSCVKPISHESDLWIANLPESKDISNKACKKGNSAKFTEAAINLKNKKKNTINIHKKTKECLSKRENSRLRQVKYRDSVKNNPKKYQPAIERRRAQQKEYYARITATPNLRQIYREKKKLYKQEKTQKTKIISKRQLRRREQNRAA